MKYTSVYIFKEIIISLKENIVDKPGEIKESFTQMSMVSCIIFCIRFQSIISKFIPKEIFFKLYVNFQVHHLNENSGDCIFLLAVR